MSLKKERDLNPTSRNQVARAKTAIQSKNFDYAITLLQAVLKDEPLFLEGRQLLRAVEIQKFESMGSFTKQMASMRMTGSMMKLSSGKKTPQEQLIASEEILTLDPFNLKANTMLADAGVTLGYPEFKCFAYETLVKAKEPKPGDKPSKGPDKTLIPLLRSLAEGYMEAKDAVKAEKVYQRILELDPRDGEALSGMKNATAAMAHKQDGWEAAKDYRDVLKDKNQAEQLEQEAKMVKSSEGIGDSIATNYEKVQAEPNNPVHAKKIGELYVQQNDYASAVQWYQYAFDVGGKLDTSLEKIIGDLKVQSVEQELQQMKAAITETTEPEAQAQAQAAFESKETELNLVRLELAEARVRSNPNEGEYRFDLGEALFKAGQYKRATEELQQSLKAPNVRYPALNLMGLAFMKRNMMDFAIKQLVMGESELLNMDEMKKQITYNLGLAYEQTDQKEKALDQWKKIYEFDMSYRDVAARVEQSYGGGGDDPAS